jgi:hypothetical protein
MVGRKPADIQRAAAWGYEPERSMDGGHARPNRDAI